MVFPQPPKFSNKLALVGEEPNENGKAPRPQTNKVSTKKHLAAKQVEFCMLNASNTKALETAAALQRRQLYYQDLITGNGRLLLKGILQASETKPTISKKLLHRKSTRAVYDGRVAIYVAWAKDNGVESSCILGCDKCVAMGLTFSLGCIRGF